MVETFSSIASAVDNAVSVFLGFGTNQVATAAAIEQVVILMGQETSSLQSLVLSLAPGTAISLEMASAKLAQAQGHYSAIEAMQAEARAVLAASSEYRQFQTALEAAEGKLDRLERTLAGETGLRILPQTLNNAAEEMTHLNSLIEKYGAHLEAMEGKAGIDPDALADAAAAVEALETAIASAADGQVEFTEQILRAAGFSDELLALLGAVPSPVAEASNWADRLAQFLGLASGNANVASGSALNLANALRQAAGAALGVAQAIAQAVAQFGNLGAGMVGLAERVSPALAGLRGVANAFGIIANSDAAAGAVDRLRKMGNAIALTHQSAVLAAPGIERLNNSLAGGGGGSSTKAAAKEATTFMEGFSEAIEDAAKSAADFGKEIAGDVLGAVDSLADLVSEGLTGQLDGIEDFFSGILKIAQSTFADIIKLFLSEQIKLSLGLNVTSAGQGALQQAGGALSGLSGGGGGILNLLGGGGGVFGALSGGFTNAASAFFSNGFGGLFSSIGAQVSTAFSTGTLTSIAGALGSVALPLLAIGGIASALKRNVKDGGIQGTFGADGFTGNNFTRLGGNLFSGATTRTSALDPQTQVAIDTAFETIRDGVVNMAEVVGLGADAIEGFSHDFKVSLRGLTEEEQIAAIEREMGGLAGALAEAALGANEFSRAGEDSLQTLERLSTSLSVVNDIFDLLGHSTFAASLEAADVASQMAEAAGGVEAFANAARTYFDIFYTEAEQASYLERTISDALSDLGVTMPRTRAEFRGIVDAIDLSTSAGQNLYATMISLAGSFDEMLTLSGQSVTAFDAINEFLRGASQSEFSAASPSQIRARRRALFEDALARARGGDQSAVSSLPSLTESLLGSLRSGSSSDQNYRIGAAGVLRELRALSQGDPVLSDTGSFVPPSALQAQSVSPGSSRGNDISAKLDRMIERLAAIEVHVEEDARYTRIMAEA